MARNWKRIDVSSITDEATRNLLSQVDMYLQDVAASIQRLGRGEKVDASSSSVVPPARIAITENNELIGITGRLNKVDQISVSGVQTLNLVDAPSPGMYRVTCFFYMITALADTMSILVNFDNGPGPISLYLSDPGTFLNAQDFQTGTATFFHNALTPISVTVTPSNTSRLYNLHLIIEAL